MQQNQESATGQSGNVSGIRKGQIVSIKPEFQDKGDSDYVWIAVSDEYPALEWAPGKVKPASVEISHLPKTITPEHAAALTPAQRLAARGFLCPWQSVDSAMLALQKR